MAQDDAARRGESAMTTAARPSADGIGILDEIDVPLAHLSHVRQRYLDDYVPQATARGMVLKGAWRSPPVDLPGRSVRLHFLWSLPDAAAFWRMRLDSVEEKIAWWREIDAIVTARNRTIMVDAMTGGTDV